jgi:transcriptional regulator with XRE-family HTH domain
MTQNDHSPIGERLRAARASRDLSLGDVAGRIGISAATLSRIENSKQSLHLPLFLELLRVLAIRPAAILEDGDGVDETEELIDRLAALSPAERSRIFAAANERSRGGRTTVASLPNRVEGLLQSLTEVRSELLNVRAALKRQR